MNKATSKQFTKKVKLNLEPLKTNQQEIKGQLL